MKDPRSQSVKGGEMTGGHAHAVFGESLRLPALSRFGEGRAAPSAAGRLGGSLDSSTLQ
jgi:hypothetical protein